MKLLLMLAGAIALAGCVSTPKVVIHSDITKDAHGCLVPVPGTEHKYDASFDATWGPGVRTSPGYLDAIRRERAGDCNARFDYLNPGKRQSPEYIAMMREMRERSDRFDLDMRIHDLEMQVLLDQNDVYVSPYSYRPYHSYYPRHH